MDQMDTPPVPFRRKIGRWFFARPKFTIPFVFALIYGFVARLTFGAEIGRQLFNTMTYGFLIFVPIGIGAITVFFASRTARLRWRAAVMMPWLPGAAFLLGVIITVLEASICIIMAAPLFFAACTIGGVVMNAVLRLAERFPGVKRSPSSLLVALLVMPYFVSAVEHTTPPPDAFHTVDTAVDIQADVETVWANIIRVPEITTNEQHTRLSHLIGVPQPVEAMLDLEGVGSIRRGAYNNGLVTIEEITEWVPLEHFRFSVRIDHPETLPPPFNVIGGPFDVLDGTYRIEPLENGMVRLHLSSTHRISTRINGYGSLWTRYILADLQNYILEIIKTRCES